MSLSKQTLYRPARPLRPDVRNLWAQVAKFPHIGAFSAEISELWDFKQALYSPRFLIQSAKRGGHTCILPATVTLVNGERELKPSSVVITEEFVEASFQDRKALDTFLGHPKGITHLTLGVHFSLINNAKRETEVDICVRA